MPDNEEVKQDEFADVVEDPTVEVQEESEPTTDLTYEEIGENRYKWEDGVVTDAEGNTIEEEEANPENPEPIKETSAPQTVTAVSGQRQIYTRDGLQQAIYTETALQEIADKSLEDPLEAERMRMRLNQQFNEGRDRLIRHASSVFEQEMDELAKVAPQTVEKFARQIARYKENMSPEELQTPGAAKWVAAQVTAQAFAADPLTMEEAVMRSIPKTVSTSKQVEKKPEPTPKRVIPREERLPGPGTARRTESPRRKINDSSDSMVNYYMTLYGPTDPTYTIDDARAMAAEMRANDKSRPRVTER